jgi:hypothetical protein
MKKLSDENFTYPAGTSVVSKQCGASDLPEPYAAQRDNILQHNGPKPSITRELRKESVTNKSQIRSLM